MTHQEKASFCQLLASLFSPPDQEMAGWIQRGSLYSVLRKYADVLGASHAVSEVFLSKKDSDGLWKELTDAYDTIFSGLKGDGICLVESFYKPWSQDPHCPLLFASARGLLMGDSALHLLALYQACGLEVPEEYRGSPDHLALELEFLSYLYQEATDAEIRPFINDHLNWIPLLKEAFHRADAPPFYTGVLELLDLFLKKERARLEAT